MSVDDWASVPPLNYSIATGFFPEAQPKRTWETNPRPLLICGRAKDAESGMIFCRVAYGTTQKLNRSHDDDLIIANLSMLDQLGLKHPTRFVTHSGRQMAILPWTPEFFSPWSGKNSPVLSVLDEDMQRFVGWVLSGLDDLPQF